MSSRSRVSEIQGMDSSKIRNFPFSSFKLLGGLQIGIGTTCLLLGIIDLFLFLYISDYDDDTLSALTIATVPVWCGLWFIVCGSMGSCMSLEQKSTLSYFKATFMVLSVLCAILFGPALVAVEVYIVVLRTGSSTEVFEWLLPLMIAFFGFNEMICAIITAAICCCCSPLNQAKVRVVYTRQLDEFDPPMEEKRRLETPEIFYTESSRTERARRAHKEHPQQRAPVQHAITYPENRRDRYDNENVRERERERRDDPDIFVNDVRHDEPYEESPRARRQPRAVMSAGSPPMTHYSRPTTDGGQSYRKLKLLALPGNPDDF